MTQEFHISVTPIGTDQYLVRTEDVPSGVSLAEEQVTWDVNGWLMQTRQLMNHPLVGLLQGNQSGKGEAAAQQTATAVSLPRLGQELYNALFQGTMRDSWIMAQAIAQHRGEAMRLRLGLKGARLPRLPWEVLQSSAIAHPVATGTHILFSRYQPGVRLVVDPQQTTDAPSIAVEPGQPLRILMVTAAPNDQDRLELHREVTNLQQELQAQSTNADGSSATDIQVTILEQPGREQLTHALEQGNFQVLHYAGHSDLGTAGGSLYLVNRRTGLTEILSGDDLAGLLVNNGIRLAVFNSCRGAHPANSEPTSERDRSLAEALIGRGIPAVLAMAEQIPDNVSLSLTQMFYRNLKQDYPIDLSLSRTRQVLMSNYGSDRPYWALPILYIHPDFNGYLAPGDRTLNNPADRLVFAPQEIGNFPMLPREGTLGEDLLLAQALSPRSPNSSPNSSPNAAPKLPKGWSQILQQSTQQTAQQNAPHESPQEPQENASQSPMQRLPELTLEATDYLVDTALVSTRSPDNAEARMVWDTVVAQDDYNDFEELDYFDESYEEDAKVVAELLQQTVPTSPPSPAHPGTTQTITTTAVNPFLLDLPESEIEFFEDEPSRSTVEVTAVASSSHGTNSSHSNGSSVTPQRSQWEAEFQQEYQQDWQEELATFDRSNPPSSTQLGTQRNTQHSTQSSTASSPQSNPQSAIQYVPTRPPVPAQVTEQRFPERTQPTDSNQTTVPRSPNQRTRRSPSEQYSFNFWREFNQRRSFLLPLLGAVSAMTVLLGLWVYTRDPLNFWTPAPVPVLTERDLGSMESSQLAQLAIDRFNRGARSEGVKAVRVLLDRNALAEAESAIAVIPADQRTIPEILFLQGRIDWQNARFTAAHEAWQAAVNAAPANSEYHKVLGFAHYAEDETLKALESLQQARVLLGLQQPQTDSSEATSSEATSSEATSSEATSSENNSPGSRDSTESSQSSDDTARLAQLGDVNALTIMAGMAIALDKLAQDNPAQESFEQVEDYRNSAISTYQFVNSIGFAPDSPNNRERWLWTEIAIEDWQRLGRLAQESNPN